MDSINIIRARTNIAFAFLLITTLSLLTGCKSPVDEGWTPSGIIITDKSTAFIQDGVTTRSEVIRNLGAPAYDFKLERTMAYSREMKKSHWGFQVFDDSDSFSNKSDRDLFCLRFNESDQVTRHAVVRVKSPETPRDTIIRWNKGK